MEVQQAQACVADRPVRARQSEPRWKVRIMRVACIGSIAYAFTLAALDFAVKATKIEGRREPVACRNRREARLVK